MGEKPEPSLEELIEATRRRLEGLRLETPDLSKLAAPSDVPSPELPPLKDAPTVHPRRALLGTLLDKVSVEIDGLKPPGERARVRQAAPRAKPPPQEPAEREKDVPSPPQDGGAPINLQDLPAPNRPWIHTSAAKRSWLERLGAWLRLR